MHAPVKVGHAHRRLGRLGTQGGGAEGVAGVMPHGFGHRPEQQADAHAGAEQHGQPGNGAELGFLAVLAEGHIAVTAGHQIQQIDQHARGHGQVEPLEVLQDTRGKFAEYGTGLLAHDGAEADECRDYQGRYHGDPGVYAVEHTVGIAHSMCSVVIVCLPLCTLGSRRAGQSLVGLQVVFPSAIVR
ncbi:hypothetical protein D3C84_375760 [compost metagenome]